MRTQIKHFVDKKVTVKANIEYVTYHNRLPIIRINHVIINNETRVNHCWIYIKNLTDKKFRFKNNLEKRIKFTAMVGEYYKIRNNKKIKDYNLININNIEVI